MQHPPETPKRPTPPQLPTGKLVQGVTEESYDQDDGLRSSELKHAVRSAAHWQAYLAHPAPDTKAMEFGRLIHMAVLEPDRLKALGRVRPDFGDLRSKKARDEADAWKADLPPGAIIYTAEDRERMLCISRKVRNHKIGKALLHYAKTEVALTWHDDEYDLRCKARYDIVTADGFVADIKTTQDASYDAFAREMVSRNYTLSAAHYLEGMAQTGAGQSDRFYIVAVEKEPPYELAVFSLMSSVLRRGRWWQRHALATIKQAQKTGVFAGYSESTQQLEEPGYAPLPPGYTRQQLYEE